ncbi:Translocation protein SEC62 [Geodia barretti]|uniref:Translocation protein SEC62 n=1 Tax=Geodia barretti TaxID=519541 RepID=A0AA35XLJ4_GEOBA|nr:Translocation protein SEC62 [Geodia barretti]
MSKDKKTLEGVAKYLRFNVRTKAAVLKREKVEYFTGSAAVDTLMKSKWAVVAGEASEGETKKPKKHEEGSEVEFHTRADAVSFCNYLIDLQYMLRVNKVEVKASTDTTDTGDDEATQPSKSVEQESDQPKKPAKTKVKGEEAKKKKKRYRLEIHQKQQFRDSDDLYIWKYNPPSTSTYVIGFVVVLGAVAWTLQPLWPASTRVAMWYVAMAAACVIGVLLVLLVLRWFLFGIVVVATLGKVHFWVFPNLNEEKYGFVDSFKPIYSIERSGDS